MGGLTKTGLGTLILTGANTHAGGTAINGGTLRISSDANLGASSGPLSFDNGTLETALDMVTARATTLALGGGTFAVTNASTLTHNGTVSGAGSLIKSGDGALVLAGTNSYAGPTHVVSGALYANGDQTAATGPVTVENGAVLGGRGTLGGDVAILDGGTISPGASGPAAGTLVINGDLRLAPNSLLAYSLGQANVAGGPLNDLTVVRGDVTLDGTLNVATSPGGAFATGVYRIISYGGSLTDNGLSVGTIPSPNFHVQTSISNQVNLVNTNGLLLNFWDGAAGPKNNSVVDGGDGVWQNSSGNDNWTEATGSMNAPWSPGAVAIFQGASGTVTIDDGLGVVNASGMQFATDAYVLSGQPLMLLEDGPGTGRSVIRVGDGTASSAAMSATISAVLEGNTNLEKTDLGNLVLTGSNSYTGGTTISGGTLQLGNGGTSGSVLGDVTNNGALNFNRSDSTVFLGAISGSGSVRHIGSGTTTLVGANSYAGGTTFNDGVLQVSSDTHLGALTGGLHFDGGTLGTTADMATTRVTTLDANGGTFATAAATTLVHSGMISGVGTLRKIGDGALILTGDSTYAGGTVISAGALQLGTGGTDGSIIGNVLNDGTLLFNRSDDIAFDGVISGSGQTAQIGSGTTVLTGNNSYSGPTLISSGALFVNGDQTAAAGLTTVAGNAILGGAGVIGGDVIVADNATLFPGNITPGRETLTIKGDLTLNAGSLLDYSFGAADVVGGPFNDLVVVGGDLVLDGTLDVTVTLGGSFGTGTYRLINYAGALTDNGLTLGTLPSSAFHVQTSIAKQVNLVNTNGLLLNFWDGAAGPKNDGHINGGDGLWQNHSGNENWTQITGTPNAPWADGAFAIFQGAPGIVSVDNSLGAVTASGMQFAVDGYRVNGNSLGLVGPAAEIRVGDGTAAGADFTVTIDAQITGSSQLVKTDLGTLELTGSNSYGGGTSVNGGVLQVSDNSNLGALAGALRFDTGTLRTIANMATARVTTIDTNGGTLETASGTTLIHAGVISGAGMLTKAGAGTLALTADSTIGRTAILAGTLQVGVGGTSGSITGDVINDGVLSFNRIDDVTFSGRITGNGSVVQAGSGTTILAGANTYLGETLVSAGVLQAGGANSFSADSSHRVAQGAMLSLAGHDQTVRTLINAGRVSMAANDVSALGTVLTVTGDYVGEGGTTRFNTQLDGDRSATDLLRIDGNSTGHSQVQVINVGGAGAQTDRGIKLIDVAGASNGVFQLLGDFTATTGQQAVVGGAYAYTLNQNSDTADGDWYLRSELRDGGGTNVDPAYNPGTPLYESYPQVLLVLNTLPTLRQRVGARSWTDGDDSAVAGNSTWGRIDVGRRRSDSGHSTTGATQRSDGYALNLGLDITLKEDDGWGVLVGGLTALHGVDRTDVRSIQGNGRIRTDAYGLGATMTWYNPNGFYADAQAAYSWYASDLDSNTADRSMVEDNDGRGVAASIEAGWKRNLGQTYKLTPQAQLVYSQVSFDTFSDAFRARVSDDKGESVRGRLGLALEREAHGLTSNGRDKGSHVYAIANIYYEFLDGVRVTVAGADESDPVPFATHDDRFWGGLGIGGVNSWNENRVSLFAEVNIDTSLQHLGNSPLLRGRVGVRAKW
nr:autotransporter outer membrane beta-barrel domain-containing protein [Stenotrophomonas sp. SY1]